MSTTSFGDRVKAARKSLGLSVREVARRSGVTAMYIYEIEHGNNTPGVVVAGRLATVLGLTIDELCLGKKPDFDVWPLVSALSAVLCAFHHKPVSIGNSEVLQGAVTVDAYNKWLTLVESFTDVARAYRPEITVLPPKGEES